MGISVKKMSLYQLAIVKTKEKQTNQNMPSYQTISRMGSLFIYLLAIDGWWRYSTQLGSSPDFDYISLWTWESAGGHLLQVGFIWAALLHTADLWILVCCPCISSSFDQHTKQNKLFSQLWWKHKRPHKTMWGFLRLWFRNGTYDHYYISQNKPCQMLKVKRLRRILHPCEDHAKGKPLIQFTAEASVRKGN